MTWMGQVRHRRQKVKQQQGDVGVGAVRMIKSVKSQRETEGNRVALQGVGR